MTWIMENWGLILQVWGGLVLLASLIVKATPSQKDDAILAKVMKVVEFFSIFEQKPPKQPLG